jgi:Rps23 Pro-64 3,4-dihydroxylase Tpa1-like proline 4-hydroxylase
MTGASLLQLGYVIAITFPVVSSGLTIGGSRPNSNVQSTLHSTHSNVFPTTRGLLQHRRTRPSPPSQLDATLNNESTDRLLPSSVYRTIEEGKIAVVPNFLNEADILPLRQDAQQLWLDNRYSTDALAGYGSKGSFDPTKDRAVLKLTQWKRSDYGNFELRSNKFANLMSSVRQELATNLNRPQLAAANSAAVNKYGIGSTEISYTRFGPGAFLKRHVDEHHEELKGRDGWSQPTRRSISWLIYLNEPDWNASSDGGRLRCFERKRRPMGQIGATTNGDLQIGWMTESLGEIPVYLDAKNHDHGECAMYLIERDGRRAYITKPFKTNPIMYVAGSEQLVKKLLIDSPDVASRFRLIEPPKSKLNDILKGDDAYMGQGELPRNLIEEELEDVDPLGGTLVLFDSVSLPHEVLATRNKERWACSGWYHEDQQEIAKS